MRAAWFGQSQASAPSARGQHRMRRLLAQVTVASLLLVTLGLAGLPTPGSQASAAQTGLGQPDDDGAGGGDGTLPAPGLVQPTFIADSPPATATVGTAFSYSFTATGTPSPTFSAASLPGGLTLTAAGVLSGVPTQSGAFTFTVAADNGVGQPATVTRTIDVAGPGTISWDAPPPATVGVPYSFAIKYTGYPAPIFTTSEVLPPGLTLSAEGVVSGTPTAAGSRVVTFNAAQLVSGSSLIMLEFVVNAALAPDAAPILTADAPPATADVGQPYSYTFTATGVPAPTFHLSSGLLPTGMNDPHRGWPAVRVAAQRRCLGLHRERHQQRRHRRGGPAHHHGVRSRARPCRRLGRRLLRSGQWRPRALRYHRDQLVVLDCPCAHQRRHRDRVG